MSRSFVTDAVVATLERLGRGSCADIERWGGIAEGGLSGGAVGLARKGRRAHLRVGAVSREVRAEGHLGAGLRAERGATCAKAPPIPGGGCEGQPVRR